MNISEYILRYKRQILLVTLFALVTNIIAFIIPLFIRILLTNVELKGKPAGYFLLFALTLIVMYCCTLCYRLFLLNFSLNFKCMEFKMIFKRLFKVKLPVIQEKGPTYYTERILTSGDRLFEFIGISVAETIVTIISILICLGIVFMLSRPLFIMFILLIPANFLSYKKMNRKLQAKCVELQKVSAVNLGNVINIVQNIESIKQVENHDSFSQMLGKYLYAWQKQTQKVNQYGMLMSATINFFTDIIRNGTLLFTVYYFVTNKMVLADVIFINLIFVIYFDAISKLNNININLRDIKASLSFIDDEIISQQEVDTGKENLSNINTISIQIQKFGYIPEHEIIKNIHLEIQRGQKISIVGKTGSGKTTLAKLLMRFQDNIQKISINNQNIYSFSLDSLRKKIYLALQNPHLFPGTVMENITIGLTEIMEDKFNTIISLPFLSNLIKELPEGLDTQIGESGFNLSGGQKQKIMIARMLMHNPDLIIFDESTSSMDSRSEEGLYLDIAPFIKDKTVIKMSHRLATIKDSDFIVFLKDGGIQNIGSHNELLKISGEYIKLFGRQITDLESKTH